MVDLSAEMADLWGALGAPAAGHARIIQLAASRPAEGTSTVARELAFYAASRLQRRVWLVDLDLLESAQHAALAQAPERFGALGKATAGTPDGSVFFTVRPAAATPDGGPWPDSRYLCAHRVGRLKMWVTRFRREQLNGRQQVHVLPRGDYWAALRPHADLIIVDSPSPDRSHASLTLAPLVDQTVLVVAADEPDVTAPAAMRDALVGAGGQVAGLFVNRVAVETPGFLRAFLR